MLFNNRLIRHISSIVCCTYDLLSRKYDNLLFIYIASTYNVGVFSLKLCYSMLGDILPFVKKHKYLSIAISLICLTVVIFLTFLIGKETNYIIITLFGSSIFFVLDKKIAMGFYPEMSDKEEKRWEVIFHFVKTLWAGIVPLTLYLSKTSYFNMKSSGVYELVPSTLLGAYLIIFFISINVISNNFHEVKKIREQNRNKENSN